MSRLKLLLALVAFAAASFWSALADPAARPARPSIILATTTSTYDSGLLDFILPKFEARTGYRVKPIAVGTGEALAMGRRGEADLLLVHDPEAEETFVKEGYGSARHLLMRNSYLLVGPAADPAGVASSSSAREAFVRIGKARALFVSRGDRSGTHKRELTLWRTASIKPEAPWYLEAGQGMGETLRIADVKQGYTLTDESTFLTLQAGLRLKVLKRSDPDLLNTYSVIELNATRFPRVNGEGGRALAGFLTGADGRALIGLFGKEKFGRSLFEPVVPAASAQPPGGSRAP